MDLSRRGFLVGTVLAGGAALAGAAGTLQRSATGSDTEPAAPASGYLTLPGKQPPKVTVRRTGTVASGLLFVAPFRGTDYADALIVDDDGEPVWFRGSDDLVTDLRVQTYKGEPVLAYWEGARLTGGHGAGSGILLDRTYRKIAEVRAGHGMDGDLHEFQLTDRGTALITAYPEVTADLRPIGGPRDGHVYGCRVQEVDVATGEVLLDWKALDHIAIAETRMPMTKDTDGTKGRTFDPIHVNSVQAYGDTLLISARDTCALYCVDRRTGAVRWRLGGRRSDFAIGSRAAFAWQHDARRLDATTISLFDNHITNVGDGPSRGLVLKIDERARKATLLREYTDGRTYGQYMGNVQMLPGGNALVGYGSTATVIEYGPDRKPVMEMTGAGSYRAYRAPWSARPMEAPSVAVAAVSGGRMRVHASWNGATDVAAWRFLTDADAARLTVAATSRRTGFETAASMPVAPRVVAEALAGNGTVLGRSAAQAVSV
ncbi:arylsulfotransferase family protein [Actinomadura violacea]|uniref:Arylsulfotransferase family protein n=1 Tax=Actinomadura violacea TaxID=2819934 RepID=A0ABS3S789_9ACTN|nr:arylsulfotransferase family protein [Actinomadura violacea]MBO2464869.1 arylsulfotransferase family protein [Actinomadura violacea]